MYFFVSGFFHVMLYLEDLSLLYRMSIVHPSCSIEFYCGTIPQCIHPFKVSLVAQLVKNLPAVWETWVRSLGWEDSLEKGTAAHSSILAWRIPWTV